MDSPVVFLCVLLLYICSGAEAQQQQKTNSSDRNARFLSVFQVVTFPNNPCVGTTSKNGTCYTAAECSNRGGTNVGSCASGYGVCCTFTLACGQKSSENNTYFDSSSTTAGSCLTSVCKNNANVCQIRLDFTSFTITGPSTVTSSATTISNGQITPGGAVVSTASRCLTDYFFVSNSGGTNPPMICGTNTGDHMYMEASDECVTLGFQLGSTGIGAAIPPRQWSIKVTQYACDFPNLAPIGCTQYYFGTNTGSVRTFNFLGGQHLANQNQRICIRICWVAAQAIDVIISGKVNTKAYTKGTGCCSYGATGKKTTYGYDCVSIPGAIKPLICGKTVGLVTASGVIAATVCTKSLPFSIGFRSDGFEFVPEITKPNTGARLSYTMDAMSC